MAFEKNIKQIQSIAEKMKELTTDFQKSEKVLVDELVEWRKERKITQTALAQKFNITKAYLSDIEHGRRGVSWYILTKIQEL